MFLASAIFGPSDGLLIGAGGSLLGAKGISELFGLSEAMAFRRRTGGSQQQAKTNTSRMHLWAIPRRAMEVSSGCELRNAMIG